LNFLSAGLTQRKKPKPEPEERAEAETEVEKTVMPKATLQIIFERVEESNEQAFTVTIPQGWTVRGGILRADLLHHMVDAQSIEAKVDFTVMSDPQATVAIHWCPTVKYCDVRMTPAAMMFPQGSNYGGMVVWPLVTPQDFILQNLFPWAHPQGGQMKVLDRSIQSSLVDNYRQRLMQLGFPTQFTYEGGTATYTYLENGQMYKEIGSTIIENLGPMAGGMWCNRDTVLMRALAEEFDQWYPVLQHIYASVQLNPRWLAYEAANQEVLTGGFLNAQQAAQAREHRMNDILQHMQQVNRGNANSAMQFHQLQNANYLILMGHEEYVNPETNQIETGSNAWRYRWVNADCGEFYTDNDDDPNHLEILSRSDWVHTPSRPR
jgi:hypothetical protein